MNLVARSKECGLYSLPSGALVATTPETRAICNDSLLYGYRYTESLSRACQQVLPLLDCSLRESETCVVHLLRGGLNFGLREALARAWNWNNHCSTFLSAQRHRCESNPEEWEIAERDYRKFAFPRSVSVVMGDVVASGASLHYGLETVLDALRERRSTLRNLLFFTIGGPRTEEVLNGFQQRLMEEHPDCEGTTAVYFEGRFPTAEASTRLRIKITGTDLLRHGQDMAPEFLESQYANPMFPVERCTIYDAGSRSFEPRAYLEDVLEYWQQVANLKETSYRDYLAERCPSLDPERFDGTSLTELAMAQVERLQRCLRPLA